MAVHDWTLVEAGIFHDFHVNWIAQIRTALNSGLLPDGYYALAEQHAGQAIADVLTLHTRPEEPDNVEPWSPPGETGGTAVAEAPPGTRRHRTLEATQASRRRSLAIRHVSGHRLIALLEIVSPSNKDRAGSVADFCEKVAWALKKGVHVLVIDLFPPGPSDPRGLHEVVDQLLTDTTVEYDLPPDEPLTLASYAAGRRVEAYLEHLAVGAPALPDMPLFLRSDRYITVPLNATYEAAWKGMPAFWRDVLEKRK